ncbi:MAG TPA: molybdopterin-guanine dinucleotide biosynthesis protein B [Thermoanaerobaculaceae bacterium]|nr:molybdopterin-guanine dinucleotide biosynthesis protein B [Thermoanaerobaculaceae bacterium]HPS79662.1 molybdopterin-guanine dinucleotide biosynthesis protein B [Thermoanaerobaculaceae bacterium]
MAAIISIVGRTNVGKTTYLEKLIGEVKRRGWRVGVVKHDVHGFEIDHPGKDTWRHAQAGADIVCISGPARVALIRKLDRELSLEEVVAQFPELDLVLTEGYKREGRLRVEVYRRAVAAEPLCQPEDVIAFVSDVLPYEGVPTFGLDDPAAFAEFLDRRFGIGVR